MFEQKRSESCSGGVLVILIFVVVFRLSRRLSIRSFIGTRLQTELLLCVGDVGSDKLADAVCVGDAFLDGSARSRQPKKI